MYAILLALVPAAPPEPAPNAFVVVSTANAQPTARLVKFTPDFTATISTRIGENTIADVIALRRANSPLPPFPTGPHLITANGERIVGEILGGGQSLRFVPSIIPFKEDESWHVPLSVASVLWLTTMPADTPLDPSKYAWAEGVRNRDVFRLRNGDNMRGILVGLGPEAARPTLQFRPDVGESGEVAGKELAAIVFNPILVKPRKTKGAYVRVVLTNGSRLNLVSPTIAKDVLKGDTLFGQAVELPLDVIVALDVFQGKATYLSDLKPKKVEQGGFLGVTWPWMADRSVRGTALRLAGSNGESTFDKGLGTHPRTVLTYDLGGKYRRFEASVGLDPDAGGRGKAIVRVRVDGKLQPIARLDALTAGNAVAVRVNVEGAKELVLEVDFGAAGGVEADVNWGDARLVE